MNISPISNVSKTTNGNFKYNFGKNQAHLNTNDKYQNSAFNMLSAYNRANVTFGKNIYQAEQKNSLNIAQRYIKESGNHTSESNDTQLRGNVIYNDTKSDIKKILSYLSQYGADKVTTNYDGSSTAQYSAGYYKNIVTYTNNNGNIKLKTIQIISKNQKNRFIDFDENNTIKRVYDGFNGDIDKQYNAEEMYTYSKNGSLKDAAEAVSVNRGLRHTGKFFNYDSMGNLTHFIRNFNEDIYNTTYDISENFEYKNNSLKSVTTGIKYNFISPSSPYHVENTYTYKENGEVDEIISGFKIYPQHADLNYEYLPKF